MIMGQKIVGVGGGSRSRKSWDQCDMNAFLREKKF